MLCGLTLPRGQLFPRSGGGQTVTTTRSEAQEVVTIGEALVTGTPLGLDYDSYTY
jgi:hypothetical protein